MLKNIVVEEVLGDRFFPFHNYVVVVFVVVAVLVVFVVVGVVVVVVVVGVVAVVVFVAVVGVVVDCCLMLLLLLFLSF